MCGLGGKIFKTTEKNNNCSPYHPRRGRIPPNESVMLGAQKCFLFSLFKLLIPREHVKQFVTPPVARMSIMGYT